MSKRKLRTCKGCGAPERRDPIGYSNIALMGYCADCINRAQSAPTAPPVIASDARYPGSRVVTPTREPHADYRLPKWSGDRWLLVVSAHDHAKIGRGGPWRATVTDLPSGRHFMLRGAECGAGPHCFCAAVIYAEAHAADLVDTRP